MTKTANQPLATTNAAPAFVFGSHALESEELRERGKLIRKLRWLGLEEEAASLIATLSEEERGCIMADPACTD